MRAGPLAAILLTMVAMAGCSPGNPSPAPSASPAHNASSLRATPLPRLTPMTEADIRRSAIRCLEPPPYPCDGGPTCLRPDGSWIGYSGWGNQQGRYRIEGHRIILLEPPSVRPQDTWKIALFRTARGNMAVIDESPGSDHAARAFQPIAEAEYWKSIGPRVPPPRAPL